MDSTLIERILTIRHVVRARQLAAVHLVCLLVAFITRRRLTHMNRANLPTKDVILHRKNVREEMLHNLSTSGKCRDIIRMSEKAFRTLCNILVRDGDLRPTQRMFVEEQVARFLHVVGNDLRNRFASWIYRRSGSTTTGVMDEKETQEHKVKREPKLKEPKVKKEQFGWTSDMDDAFIQAMLTQQDKGNRPKGTFSSLAYANMVDELRTKLKLDFTKARLKNRLKTIKENFAYCHDVIRGSKLSGFSWNSMTQLIEAEEEVWEKLEEVNPDAIKWRTKPISNYDELSQLFAKDRASGVASQTAKEKNAKEKKGQSSNKEPIDVETIEDIDELLATNKVTYENLVNLEEIHVDSPMPDASNATKSKNKKRKLEEESNLDIMSTVHVGADAIKEGNLVLQETNVILGRAYQREYTGDEIYKELEPLQLEDDVISNALIFFADNPKKARLLFSCPLKMREDLLKKMMGSSDEMSSI
ncbi:myb/SANT-like domain-containing protein [Artemisia annua]|uniref:Myb/SANT-like domain-containing protein n=1 Tax=Artemisia annua TaxID=35608 RepID=A0A2U1M5B0_ARTAN|nr:myb/SANT-like domain-containing protein [Artemisia annua]